MVRAGLLLPQQATPAGAECLELCHVSCQASRPVIKDPRDLRTKPQAPAQARRRPRSSFARTPRCAPGCLRTVTCTGRARPADARAYQVLCSSISWESEGDRTVWVYKVRARGPRGPARPQPQAHPSAAGRSATRMRAGAQVQDTPGYGDNCSILSNIAEMVAYVERQNAAFLRVEQDVRRAVDLCGPCLRGAAPAPLPAGARGGRRARRARPAPQRPLMNGRPGAGPTSRTRAWTCASSACPRTACAPST